MSRRLIFQPDRDVLSLARQSVPKCLVLRKLPKGVEHAVGGVCTCDCECGGRCLTEVIARQRIRKHTAFGPLIAPTMKLTSCQMAKDVFRIYDIRKEFREYAYDLTDERLCNWLMFVSIAQDKSSQNLAITTVDDKIYFVTVKSIEAGTELKVWYSKEYAKNIGKSHIPFQSVVPTRSVEVQTDPTNDDLLSELTDINSDFSDLPSISEYAETVAFGNELLDNLLDRVDDLDVHVKSEAERACSSSSFSTIYPAKIREKKARRDVKRGAADRNVVTNSCSSEQTTSKEESQPCSMIHKKLKTAWRLKQLSVQNHKKAKNQLSHARFISKLLQCQYCDRIFKKVSTLREHEKEHGSIHSETKVKGNTKKFRCPFKSCDMVFSKKFLVERHSLLHSKRLHLCPFCGKTFHRQDALNSHTEKLHSEVRKKKYQCEKCLKRYFNSFSLKLHLAIHTAKEGCKKCPICEESFPTSEQTISHVRSHVGTNKLRKNNKSFSCELCQKSFTFATQLRRHYLVHGDKRFTCSKCNRAYSRKDNLNRHERKCTASTTVNAESNSSEPLSKTTVQNQHQACASTGQALSMVIDPSITTQGLAQPYRVHTTTTCNQPQNDANLLGQIDSNQHVPDDLMPVIFGTLDPLDLESPNDRFEPRQSHSQLENIFSNCSGNYNNYFVSNLPFTPTHNTNTSNTQQPLHCLPPSNQTSFNQQHFLGPPLEFLPPAQDLTINRSGKEVPPLETFCPINLSEKEQQQTCSTMQNDLLSNLCYTTNLNQQPQGLQPHSSQQPGGSVSTASFKTVDPLPCPDGHSRVNFVMQALPTDVYATTSAPNSVL